MNTIKLCIISGLLIITIGCASITRGSKDTLVVNSDPSGAKVSLSIGLSGKTPCAFKVSRKGGFVVKIEKEGYETIEFKSWVKSPEPVLPGWPGMFLLEELLE